MLQCFEQEERSTFFTGSNAEHRYLQSESCSSLQYMGFSVQLKKSGTQHTGTDKCMKMSFSPGCLACILTQSLTNRDCLGRLYSLKKKITEFFLYLLSKRETCKISSGDVSSRLSLQEWKVDELNHVAMVRLSSTSNILDSDWYW